MPASHCGRCGRHSSSQLPRSPGQGFWGGHGFLAYLPAVIPRASDGERPAARTDTERPDAGMLPHIGRRLHRTGGAALVSRPYILICLPGQHADSTAVDLLMVAEPARVGPDRGLVHRCHQLHPRQAVRHSWDQTHHDPPTARPSRFPFAGGGGGVRGQPGRRVGSCYIGSLNKAATITRPFPRLMAKRVELAGLGAKAARAA